MIRLFSKSGGEIKQTEGGLKTALWIDLVSPSAEEEKSVEEFLGSEIPTREEMREIELSNRFYEENGALYMTVNILTGAGGEPEKHAVTIILAKNKLVTIRYVEPESFKIFESRLNKCEMGGFAKEFLLTELLEAFINRLADAVEMIDSRVNAISRKVFTRDSKARKKRDKKHFYNLLRELGLCGDLLSKSQESLMSIIRLIAFLQPQLSEEMRGKLKPRLDSINHDTTALRDHNSFMIDKITFLQDGTLGLINIQQNDIMKLFSIVAVCFMPSTLVVGFFGMNFKRMPLLDWNYGFEFSIFLMFSSLLISFWLFVRKGWV